MIVIGTLALMMSACAERKARLWIEPPPGYLSRRATQDKILYHSEDLASGKKTTLVIPVTVSPQKLVVMDKVKSRKMGINLASSTKADQILSKNSSKGKSAKSGGKEKNEPTVSYFLGVEQIEKMFEAERYADAVTQITYLLEQYPEQARLHLMQGTLFRRMGEPRLALASYQQFLKKEKENPKVEEIIAQLQDELGEY